MKPVPSTSEGISFEPEYWARTMDGHVVMVPPEQVTPSEWEYWLRQIRMHEHGLVLAFKLSEIQTMVLQLRETTVGGAGRCNQRSHEMKLTCALLPQHDGFHVGQTDGSERDIIIRAERMAVVPSDPDSLSRVLDSWIQPGPLSPEILADARRWVTLHRNIPPETG